MRNILLLTIMTLGHQSLAAEVSPGDPTSWTGNVHFSLGAKSLSDDKWGDEYNDHLSFGIGVDLERNDWPVQVTIDSLTSIGGREQSGHDHYVFTNELAVGIKKTWDVSDKTSHYLGLGLSLLTAGRRDEIANGKDQTDHGYGAGLWISSGVNWKLSSHCTLGLSGRYNYGEVDIDDTEYNAGGISFELATSIHW